MSTSKLYRHGSYGAKLTRGIKTSALTLYFVNDTILDTFYYAIRQAANKDPALQVIIDLMDRVEADNG